jgi:hypothetical protein
MHTRRENEIQLSFRIVSPHPQPPFACAVLPNTDDVLPLSLYNCNSRVISVDVQTYLNLPSTQALLGVDKHIKHYEMSSRLVATNFVLQHDFSHQTYYYVANLLERGIKVLNVSFSLSLFQSLYTVLYISSPLPFPQLYASLSPSLPRTVEVLTSTRLTPCTSYCISHLPPNPLHLPASPHFPPLPATA